MIFAQHGSRRAPHVFFDVLEEERYSETLDRHFAHRVLRIGYNYKGLTEIGGLVLRPEFRRHPERLGRSLAYVRFLYLARHRQLFRDEVLSELMPPLEPDGTSLLWESLGRRFTGLTYQEADRLSQTNKEFIRALFPAGSDLRDAAAAARAGAHRPGRARDEGGREAAARGGVRLRPPDRSVRRRAALSRARPTTSRWSRRRGWRGWPTPPHAPIDAGGRRQTFLVARERPVEPRFVAARVELASLTDDERIALPDDVRRALEVTAGDEVAVLRIA